MDIISYDKHTKHAPGYGYEARKAAPSSIVVHSTSSSALNTAFSAEARYLNDSPLVSAHYLIGKDGAAVRFLDPRPWAAWHAGNARVDWLNQHSIGIELHHSVGDPPYPKAQLDALAALLRSLMALFTIPVDKIETHGQIAIAGPYIRKSDPSDMSHDAFLQFRSALVSAPPAPPPTKRYRARGVPVYQQRQCTGPVALYLNPGAIVETDETYPEGTAHLVTGAGFIRLDQSVEPI